MEKYTIYSDGKSQCNENEYTTQSNLQHQCNYFQITNDILQKIRTKIVTVYVKTEKTLNSQSNLEKEKWSWRNQAPTLQTIPQNYRNQDSMIPAQNHKYWPVVNDRKLRDRPTLWCSPNLRQRRQEYTMEKILSLQWIMLGKLDI